MSVESEFFNSESHQRDEPSHLISFPETNYSVLDTKEFRELYYADFERYKKDSDDIGLQIRKKNAQANSSQEIGILDKLSISTLKMGNYLEQLQAKGGFLNQQETAMRMGVMLEILDEQKKRVEVAQRTTVYEPHKKSVDHIVLFPCAAAVIRFGELSLYELSKKEIEEIPAHVGYTFILDGLHQRPSGSYGLPEHTGIARDYPALLYEGMENVASYIDALEVSNIELFEKRFGNQGGFKGTAAKNAINLMQKISAIRNKVHETIIDPSNAEFPQLKRTVEKYMSDESIERVDSVYYMTNQQDDAYIDFYRAVEKLRAKGIYPEFYANILERMIESNKEYLLDKKLVSFDELQSIFESQLDNTESVNELDSVTHIFEIANKIMSQSRLRKFKLESEEIVTNSIKKPQNITISLYSDNPKKITISYMFNELDGKALEVTYDEKSQTLDWHLMQEMDSEIKQIIQSNSQTVLETVQSKIEQEKEQKNAERQARAQQIGAKRRSSGRSRNRQRPVPYEKFDKTENIRPPLTHIQRTLEEEVFVDQEVGLKRSIELPEQGELQVILKGIMPDHQQQVLDKISQFNDGKIVNMKKLKPFDGTYRITSGRYRIILQDKESLPDGTRTFSIISVEPRNKEYRDYRKGRLQ